MYYTDTHDLKEIYCSRKLVWCWLVHLYVMYLKIRYFKVLSVYTFSVMETSYLYFWYQSVTSDETSFAQCDIPGGPPDVFVEVDIQYTDLVLKDNCGGGGIQSSSFIAVGPELTSLCTPLLAREFRRFIKSTYTLFPNYLHSANETQCRWQLEPVSDRPDPPWSYLIIYLSIFIAAI